MASDSKEPDRVLVSFQCIVPSDASLPTVLDSTKISPLSRPDWISFRVPTVKIIEEDGGARQAQLVDSFLSFQERLEENGLTAEYLLEHGGTVDIGISLCPSSGQAGILLTSEMLGGYGKRPMSISVDAL